MAQALTSGGPSLVLVGAERGITVIPASTPLTRLNYFDGKFLRGSDFQREQEYLRELVALSNQGLGGGVVHGFSVALAGGDNLQISPGLAIDPAGQVLLLPQAATIGISALIAASQLKQTQSAGALPAPSDVFSDCVEVAAPPPATLLPTSDLWVIAICHAEALCGQEDVFGKLCEQACVTSTDRPLRLEGIVVRAIPLPLVTPFPTSRAVAIDDARYLRSKVAHSYFADEVLKHPSAIRRDGLLSGPWCRGAGYDSGCCEVPLAILARAGQTTLFLDPWIVRRERLDAPGRRYWQWKMRMRPWDVFLAQVLEFQCQLAEILSGLNAAGQKDPFAGPRAALAEAARLVDLISERLVATPIPNVGGVAASPPAAPSPAPRPADALSFVLSQTKLSGLKAVFEGALKDSAKQPSPTERVLIALGMLEVPPAGYLPIFAPSSVPVNAQVRALLGDGVDLRFCVVRPDFIPHAFEEAQHMDRISLIEGLDDPTKRPKVDILVPDGNVVSETASADARLYDASLRSSTEETGGLAYVGSAREEALASGGSAVYSAGGGVSQTLVAGVGSRDFISRGPGALRRLSPNLETNDFVRANPTSSFDFVSRLSETATTARRRVSEVAAVGAQPAAAPAPPAAAPSPAAPAPPVAVPPVVVSPAPDELNGYWATARAERSIRDLNLFEQTPVSGRFIVSSRSTTTSGTSTPSFQAVEIAFNGTFTATEPAAPASGGNIVVRGTFNAVATLGILHEQPSGNQEADALSLTKQNGTATFTFAESSSDSTITLDLTGAGADPSAPTAFTFTRTSSPALARVSYAAAIAGRNLARLVLREDLDVVKPGNSFHRLADHGLDIVQAAMSLSEPNFKKTVEPKLFPTLPPSTQELTLTANNDWVLFHRRREKKCTADPTVVLAKPQSYRIFNLTQDTLAEAQKTVDLLVKDSSVLIKAIQLVRQVQDRSGFSLVVEFAGDSAEPRFQFAPVDADWKGLIPGDTIVFAAYGAAGNDDKALETARLRQFEAAIRPDSAESAQTVDQSLVPYPQELEFSEADGLMFFVTANAMEAHQVYGVPDLALWDPLEERIKNGTLFDPSGADFLRRLDDLGTATYKSGSVAPVGDGDGVVVRNYRTKYGASSVFRARSLSLASDAPTAKAAHLAQTKQIEADSGGGADPEAREFRGTFPNTVSAISFLGPERIAQTNRLARVVTEGLAQGIRNSDNTLRVSFDQSGVVNGVVPDNIIALGFAVSLTGVVPNNGDRGAIERDARALAKLLVEKQLLPSNVVVEVREPNSEENKLLTPEFSELIVLGIVEIS